jgi:hypothetical protein
MALNHESESASLSSAARFMNTQIVPCFKCGCFNIVFFKVKKDNMTFWNSECLACNNEHLGYNFSKEDAIKEWNYNNS